MFQTTKGLVKKHSLRRVGYHVVSTTSIGLGIESLLGQEIH